MSFLLYLSFAFTNAPVKLGNVTDNSVSLRLSASYGETGERVRAGNVKSVIGMTFVYE
ncbi:MAG: hypothetical protein ACLTQE_05250 [Proteus mirabilis]